MNVTRYSILNCTIDQVQAVGGTNIQATKHSGIVFAELTAEQAAQLSQMGCIPSPVTRIGVDVVSPPGGGIAPPIPVAAVPTYTASELLEIAGLEEFRGLTDPPLYGADMRVAVIGTGIRETHQQLAGRVVYSKNYTSAPMRDGFDHDTGVASIIVAAAPECGILNLKVMGDSGEGTEEEVVMALDDCISLIDTDPDIAPHVINLSLGAQDDGNSSSPMRIACRAALAAGIMIFAAAGNMGPDPYTITSPACERYVIAMGAAKYLTQEKSFIVSGFSSRGPTQEGITKPDSMMFGEDIIMASSVSDTAVIAKSGTSFACPMGSVIGLLYMEGVNRQAQTKVQLGELPPAVVYYVPIDILVDEYFPRICIKPEGIPAAKDNAYGCGLPYGPYVLRALQPSAGIGIAVGELLPMMMILPMMGMLMKNLGKGK